MSKKYKLIKTYPGSPELGTIASRGMGIKFEYPNGDVGGFSSSKGRDFETLVENQPEFWEEVVEKEYEILSLSLMRSIRDEIIIATDYSDKYIEGLLACKGNSIHSVKRLSDGEVFTVGDLCNPIGKYSYSKHKITTIEFCKAGYLRIGSSDYYIGINNIEHSKTPLFTTEDGVDIYEGDYVCWIVNNKYNHYIDIKDYRKADRSMFTDGTIIYFSTKEAAEEYILMNKPCLSINDLLSNNNITSEALVGMTFRKLKELVKSKL